MIERKCPFCGLVLTNGGRHIYSCKENKENLTKDQIKLKFLEYNFGTNILENICNDYQNLYSLPMLKEKYKGIDNKSVYFLLSLKNIHIRNVSESAIKISQEKIRNTLQNKYGKGIINVGQIPEVKEKVKQSFMKHYGVDNIWKLQGYNKKCAELYPESHREHMIKLTNGRYKHFKDGIASSTIELRFCEILEELHLSYIRQFYIPKYNHPYDFRLLKANILIEINGDYWHCNPNKYNAEYYHKLKHLTAQEIWNNDKKHIAYANKNGYKVIEIWESDMLKMSNDELKKYFETILKKL